MDVPVREEGATNDEVILFTEVNDSLHFSIACEVTYYMLPHDSVFIVESYPCINVSKEEQHIVSWNVVNCHQQ